MQDPGKPKRSLTLQVDLSRSPNPGVQITREISIRTLQHIQYMAPSRDLTLWKEKWTRWKHTAPYIIALKIIDRLGYRINLRHTLDRIYLTSIYIDGLVQERCNSIANAMDLYLSCIIPSICSMLSDNYDDETMYPANKWVGPSGHNVPKHLHTSQTAQL